MATTDVQAIPITPFSSREPIESEIARAPIRPISLSEPRSTLGPGTIKEDIYMPREW